MNVNILRSAGSITHFEATARHCQDFHDRFGYLAATDPTAYLDAGVDSLTDALLFIRPAFHAALELGIETFDIILQASLAAAADQLAVGLRNAFPDATENDVNGAGRVWSSHDVSIAGQKHDRARIPRRSVCAYQWVLRYEASSIYYSYYDGFAIRNVKS
jgi:hypothetical protein